MFLSLEETTPDLEALHARVDRFLWRWAYLNAANMEPFAERMAVWMGISGVPRDARAELSALGIGIAREALPAGVLAFWCVEEGRYRIRLSPFLEDSRVNFTLWHEWLDILAARRAFPARLPPPQLERLADRFAAAFAMPQNEVRDMVKDFHGAGDKTDVMAARFGVSVTAMRRRVRALGLAPNTTFYGNGRG